MIEIQGMHLDLETTPEGGSVYRAHYARLEGEKPQPTEFTYENAKWGGPLEWLPIIPSVFGRWFINPLDFATQETAHKVLLLVREIYAPRDFDIVLENTHVTGPFNRTPERRIKLSNTWGMTIELNTARISLNIIRFGAKRAQALLQAEVTLSTMNYFNPNE
jgi:hypothetical protein